MELKTPLYEEHVKAGGKVVPFAGYLLPVQYPAGVIKEHMAVRTKAGLLTFPIWEKYSAPDRMPKQTYRCF